MVRWLLPVLMAPFLMAQNSDVLAMMKASQDAWNRGDLETFASYYEDSPETTFMGRDVVRGGTKVILERYRRGYPTREKMGTLTYSEMQVRDLAPGLVLVTGKFALERMAAGGGPSTGRYTLIVRKTPAGWKIIHDHSSSA